MSKDLLVHLVSQAQRAQLALRGTQVQLDLEERGERVVSLEEEDQPGHRAQLVSQVSKVTQASQVLLAQQAWWLRECTDHRVPQDLLVPEVTMAPQDQLDPQDPLALPVRCTTITRRACQ